MSQVQDSKILSSEVKVLLPYEILKIQFLKSNGLLRTMYGTLRGDLLPEREPADSDKPARKHSTEAQVVFDLQKQEFRSFRKDSILGWEVVDDVPALENAA